MPAQQNQPVGNNQPQGHTLADILVTQGVLTPEKAQQVKIAEVQTGSLQEDILTNRNLVNEDQLIKAKAKFYNIPYVDLENVPASPAALGILTQETAKKFNVYPIAVDPEKKELTLAMAEPMDLAAIEFIEQKTGYRIRPQAAIPTVINEFINSRYSTSLSMEVTQALRDVSAEGNKVKTLDASSRTGLIREERISGIVTHVLDFAVRSRASDIHIEPMENITRVRYRIDGILQEKLTVPKEIHEALISRIKILSGMQIDEKRKPQDGRFNFRTADQEVDLRVSSLPVSWGEKIVIRLLKKTGGVPDLQELGLRGKALKNLEDSILRPHGIVIICGPTGSGKTTTLYSIIQRLNTAKVNIMTLEDPVEYNIPGINQVQVNPVVGLTFASGLRSFLRQDPNIILVGEIRDNETAGLAIQASLTGHLVFSTLHTNDAAGALPRLMDMGIEPFLLASSMTAIAAQRVLRKIDENNREAYVPEESIIQDMKEVLGPLFPKNGVEKIYRGKPAPENNNTGYLGRVAIFEVLPITEKVEKLILQRASSDEIQNQAKADGMITLKQDGYLKVIEGITTIEEVLRVAQE